MKATVEIPDDLFVAAKKRAAELRRPLRALIEQGLRTELGQGGSLDAPQRVRKLRWVTVDGGLPKGVDLTNREAMHDWLRGQR